VRTSLVIAAVAVGAGLVLSIVLLAQALVEGGHAR
jgi:hypothetical protein